MEKSTVSVCPIHHRCYRNGDCCVIIFLCHYSFLYQMFLKMRNILFLYSFIFSLLAFSYESYADESVLNPSFSSSGLSIPRFVSLSNNETNVRVGPGQEYPIQSIYKRKGIPVEVILEYENWRKVRDVDGDEGWVYHTLLSGRRFGILQHSEAVFAYDVPFSGDEAARVVIAIEPMVQFEIVRCKDAWCYINASGFLGWIERKFIWGVYERENFD